LGLVHPPQQEQEFCPHVQGEHSHFSQVHPLVHLQSVHEQSVQVHALQQAVAAVSASALHPACPCEDILNAPPEKATANAAVPAKITNNTVLFLMVHSFHSESFRFFFKKVRLNSKKNESTVQPIKKGLGTCRPAVHKPGGLLF